MFVLLDGARWDRLSISPEFSEIKNNGVLLTNVTTTAPYTFASLNSIFTGLFGKENGVVMCEQLQSLYHRYCKNSI